MIPRLEIYFADDNCYLIKSIKLHFCNNFKIYKSSNNNLIQYSMEFPNYHKAAIPYIL